VNKSKFALFCLVFCFLTIKKVVPLILKHILKRYNVVKLKTGEKK